MKVMDTIAMNPKSCEVILAKECAIHYRFGRIPVSGLKNGQDKPEAKETTSETNLASL